MGSLGNWYAISATFAENEENSPWPPLHVDYGFTPADSAATVFRPGVQPVPRVPQQQKRKPPGA